MPHIRLAEGVPGIRSAFQFSPGTARPMLDLAEVLLRGANSLSSAEREMIAARVSRLNACHFCEASHRAAAAHHLDGDYRVVDAVLADPDSAPIGAKFRALLNIAGRVVHG
ncbi:MAG TPA: carboxymuconolactone decarboxylase family protein, partial [Luteitalea sp.]|nr:carboxymuconolactone decarboxylase family protein [Luteitalea sp.]